jgi:glyoxylase-like metal-dependent hydrolase (beta-lactamase superfamily II)
MPPRHFRLTFAMLVAAWIALPAQAVEVAFKPMTDGVYAYIGDTEGRTYDNEGLNANVGLIVTSAGAVLIDSGPTYQVAGKIEAAAKKSYLTTHQMGHQHWRPRPSLAGQWLLLGQRH